MGFGSRASLAAILGFAAAFVVACGSSGNGLLSSDQSSSIAGELTSVSAAVRAGHCPAARESSRRLANAISALPPSVNQKLVSNLGQGAATVSALAEQQCSTTQSSSTTTVSSSPSSTTAPTTTEPAPTTTQASSSTSASAPTSTSAPPTTATNGGGTGTSGNTTAGGGAPVGGQTKTSG